MYRLTLSPCLVLKPQGRFLLKRKAPNLEEREANEHTIVNSFVYLGCIFCNFFSVKFCAVSVPAFEVKKNLGDDKGI